MTEKSRFSWQSLMCCFLFNGGMIGGFFYLAKQKWEGPEQLRNLALILFGIGGIVTLVLWAIVQLMGRRLVEKGLPPPSADTEKPAKKKKIEPPSPAPAIQILSLLQRQGRLIDFLEEDLAQYEDFQIGAAVRNIHEGCKKALKENMEIIPVLEQEEGSEVTVNPGFDAHSIRLTGNIEGDPPFKGVLRHRGWQVARIELPQLIKGQEKKRVLAPAEVEIG